MSEQEIYKKLTEIFRDVFDEEALTLRPDMTADDLEEWDSANHINLVVATEAAFGIKFKSAEIEELNNVGEFVQMIKGKLV